MMDVVIVWQFDRQPDGGLADAPRLVTLYVEVVGDDGRTKGLLEAVRPEQMEVVASAGTGVRFTDIRVEKNGACAAVRFSDGKELHLSAEELHAQAG